MAEPWPDRLTRDDYVALLDGSLRSSRIAEHMAVGFTREDALELVDLEFLGFCPTTAIAHLDVDTLKALGWFDRP